MKKKKKTRHELTLPIFPELPHILKHKITIYQKKNPCRQFHNPHVTKKREPGRRGLRGLVWRMRRLADLAQKNKKLRYRHRSDLIARTYVQPTHPPVHMCRAAYFFLDTRPLHIPSAHALSPVAHAAKAETGDRGGMGSEVTLGGNGTCPGAGLALFLGSPFWFPLHSCTTELPGKFIGVFFGGGLSLFWEEICFDGHGVAVFDDLVHER